MLVTSLYIHNQFWLKLKAWIPHILSRMGPCSLYCMLWNIEELELIQLWMRALFQDLRITLALLLGAFCTPVVHLTIDLWLFSWFMHLFDHLSEKQHKIRNLYLYSGQFQMGLLQCSKISPGLAWIIGLPRVTPSALWNLLLAEVSQSLWNLFWSGL